MEGKKAGECCDSHTQIMLWRLPHPSAGRWDNVEDACRLRTKASNPNDYEIEGPRLAPRLQPYSFELPFPGSNRGLSLSKNDPEHFFLGTKYPFKKTGYLVPYTGSDEQHKLLVDETKARLYVAYRLSLDKIPSPLCLNDNGPDHAILTWLDMVEAVFCRTREVIVPRMTALLVQTPFILLTGAADEFPDWFMKHHQSKAILASVRDIEICGNMAEHMLMWQMAYKAHGAAGSQARFIGEFRNALQSFEQEDDVGLTAAIDALQTML